VNWRAKNKANELQFARLTPKSFRAVRRIGKKKALVAVGHSNLVIAYHILKNRASYRQLGGDYFDRQNVESQRARYIKRLEALGLKVSVEVVSEAAYSEAVPEFSEQACKLRSDRLHPDIFFWSSSIICIN
jgi:hypothetical protein